MFEKPDAPASELTKREVLELVLVHAFLTGPLILDYAPSQGVGAARTLASIIIDGPPDPPATPDPAEEVVGALPPELEEAAAIARGFEGKADGKTPRAVDAKGGEA